MERDDVVLDIKEALCAMTGDPEFMASGIDAAFIDMFANNMNYFEKLPASTQERIRKQFLEMAGERSYRTSVAEKFSARKSKMMVDWFKGVNLLLAMAKRGMA